MSLWSQGVVGCGAVPSWQHHPLTCLPGRQTAVVSCSWWYPSGLSTLTQGRCLETCFEVLNWRFKFCCRELQNCTVVDCDDQLYLHFYKSRKPLCASVSWWNLNKHDWLSSCASRHSIKFNLSEFLYNAPRWLLRLWIVVGGAPQFCKIHFTVNGIQSYM